LNGLSPQRFAGTLPTRTVAVSGGLVGGRGDGVPPSGGVEGPSGGADDPSSDGDALASEGPVEVVLSDEFGCSEAVDGDDPSALAVGVGVALDAQPQQIAAIANTTPTR